MGEKLMLLLSLLLGVVSSLTQHNNGMPRTFDECMEYDYTIAESKNMSFIEVQTYCKDLLADRLEIVALEMRNPNVTNYIKHLLRGIIAEVNSGKASRSKRSIFGSGLQYRREVREPPYDQNWGCFVRGVRRLKTNYDVSRTMSTYDVIASLHTGTSIQTAHDGPGFFGWHRCFVRIMEFAIGCPVPYWDTTLDFPLRDPTRSIVWSPKYFGNGYGMLSVGPLAEFPSFMPVIRNINANGWLMSTQDIQTALSKPSLYEFTEPSNCDSANRNAYSFECFHDGTHNWVDGTFTNSQTAAFDPLFYPYHAFVDKIFKEFKQRLGNRAVYPNKGIQGHQSNDRMVFYDTFPGIESLTQEQGIGDNLDQLMQYSPTPSCPTCAGSEDLYCNTELNICVSKERSGMDAMAMSRRVQMRMENGEMMMMNIMEPDDRNRVTRMVDQFGPLPFAGRRFNVGMRDSRTSGSPMPYMQPE